MARKWTMDPDQWSMEPEWTLEKITTEPNWFTQKQAYTHPVYHGGKNQPEQVTDEFLCCWLCKVPGMKEPRVWQCGHTFCLPCIEGYLTAQGLPCEGDPVWYPEGVIARCPQCRIPMKLPYGGPYKMSKNLFVDTQVDRILMRMNRQRGRDKPGDRSIYNIGEPGPHHYVLDDLRHARFDFN